MRIFTLLLIFICLLNVRLHAQQTPNITLSVKNVPLENVLGQIKKQAGVTFIYNEAVLKKIGKISMQAEKADLQTVLKLIFRNTSVSYIVEGSIVVLTNKKDPNGNVTTDSSFFYKGTVHGFVYDTKQQGLSGASVVIKRSHQGTITNNRGEFTLDNVRTNDTLSISFIGYATQNIPVNGRTDLSVILNETKNDLDQVVVQAYGTTTKRLTVGEITQINAKDIEKQPVTNPILALEGMVPGMVVTPTSGYSGAPVKIVIRGQNSIDANAMTDPLYIIDGVPLITTATATSYGASIQQAYFSYSNGQSPFFSLNPNDIESISVLKDAEATAMYGSRAGNGVIIITTKKGKPGATQFDISVDQSVNKTIGQWDMLNTSQYLQMRREAFSNDGITPTVANAPDLTLWDTTRNTNWQKELFKNSNNTNVSASLSGGNNFLTFRMSAAYSAVQDFSALSNDNKNQRATVNLGFDYHSANQKLSISLSALYGYTTTSQISPPSAITLAPDAPLIFDNGNLNYGPWNAAGLGNSFPFGLLLAPTLANTYFLNSSVNINYQLFKGLNIGIALGYNNAQGNGSSTVPIAAQNPINNPLGSAVFGNNSNIGFNINPQAAYEHYIGKGKLQALIGATLNNTNAQGITLFGKGYTSDALLKSIMNAPVQTISQYYSQNKYLDLHGRLNYNWENKYIVEATGNRDGSSSFGPGKQFGNFWSVGANWIASEEKWLKEGLPSWVSLIKLSGTYGTTGVSGGDYQYLSQWSGNNPVAGAGQLYQYNGSLPLVPINAVNQDYHWETDKAINASLDLGFLNDRFNLHVTFYQKRVNDQLTLLPTPVFTGFPSVEGNSRADVQNTGIEVNLNANLITAKDFSWSANFNISHNANKLLAFPGIQYSSYYFTEKVGESVGTVYLLHYLGINQQTGQRSYQDYNHDGVITINNSGPPAIGTNDRYIAIDPTSPKFYGGGGTNLRYKNLTLSLQFSFEKKITQAAYTSAAGGLLNVPVEVFNNSWQKSGDIAVNPRFTTTPLNSDNIFIASDGAYTDGSFIRLQNVNIAYALPVKLVKCMGVKGISVIISMENVLTFTKYDGIDPDAPFGSLPQPKVFNGKLLFNF